MAGLSGGNRNKVINLVEKSVDAGLAFSGLSPSNPLAGPSSSGSSSSSSSGSSSGRDDGGPSARIDLSWVRGI